MAGATPPQAPSQPTQTASLPALDATIASSRSADELKPAPSSPGGVPTSAASSAGSKPGGAASGVPSGTPASSVGSKHGALTPSAVFGTAPPVDLTNENLLLSAARVEYNGRTCPALGGIPLLRKLGQGGMGAVYAGMHPRLHVEVAVKVLPYHLQEKDPVLIERFFREAQISAAVHSPHLVNVMDVNDEHGVFFLVMEYVRGKSAKEHLEAVLATGAQGLSERDALRISVAAVEGLRDAHAQGIVHRDVKPDNVMIPYKPHTQDLDLSAAKLMDLGLARGDQGVIGAAALTQTKQAMGTPGFMAPEQIMDARSAGPPADVFAMGATIYALFAGQAPFKKKNHMQTLMATLQSPHEPLINVRPDISPALSAIVDKCLAKAKEERFTDGQQLLPELEQCLKAVGGKADIIPVAQPRGEEPEAAAEAGATPQPAAAARPKRGLLLIGAACAAAILVAAAVYFLRKGPPAGEVISEYDRMLNNAKRALMYDPELARDSLTTARVHREKHSITEPRLLEQESALESLIRAVGALEGGSSLDEVEAHIEPALKAFPYDGNADPKKDPMAKVCQEVVLRRIKEGNDALGQGDLAAAEKCYRGAAKIIPDHAGLQSLRDALVGKRVAAINESIAKFAFDDAEKQLAALTTLDPKNRQLEDLDFKLKGEKVARRTFEAKVKDAKTKLASDGDIEVIEGLIEAAAKRYASDPQLKPLRQGAARKRLEVAEQKLQKEELDEADANLKKAAALVPDDAKIAQLRQRYDETKAKRDKFAGMVADIAGDLKKKDSSPDSIDKKIEAAAELYKDDPEIVTLRNNAKEFRKGVNLAELMKKQDDQKKELAQADELIKTFKFEDAEQHIAAAEKILPDDAKVPVARARLAEKKKAYEAAEAEKGRRNKFLADLGKVDDILASLAKALPSSDAKPADAARKLDEADQKLADSEKRLADADKVYPEDAETSVRRETLGELRTKVKRGRFDNLLKLADAVLQARPASLADDETNAAEADKLIQQAAALSATDKALEPRRAELKKKLDAIAAEKSKREKFDRLVKDADNLLKAQPASLADMEKANQDIDKTIKDAEALYPADTAIKPLRARLVEKQAEAKRAAADKQKLEQFNGLLRNAETALAAKDSKLADIDKTLTQADGLFPGDPKVKALRDQYDKRVAADKAALEQQRKAQIADKVKELGALIAAGDLPKAEAGLADALKTFPNESAFAPVREELDKKLAEKNAALAQQRKEQVAGKVKELNALIAAGDLAKAETALADADKAFPNEPAFTSPRQQLAQLNNQKKLRAQFETLLKTAEEQLLRGKVKEADATLKSAEQLIPGDAAAGALRGKIAAAGKTTRPDTPKPPVDNDPPKE